ncbi:hypothetical protein Tco_0123570 [Tanacetum coccineum]
MKGYVVSFLNFLLIRYGSYQVEDSVWSKRYSEWCNENSHDKKPRPRDYTFKEWVKLKKGHLDISKSVRKDLFRLWVIDKSTKALDPDEDPFGRCLDGYNWVFPKEIEQLADEYEIKIRDKGQVLEEIWTKCKRARCKDKDWWFDTYNRGLVHVNPTSLPPQPIGEATKASNLRRIPPGVQGRSHFTYFLYLIIQIQIL